MRPRTGFASPRIVPSRAERRSKGKGRGSRLALALALTLLAASWLLTDLYTLAQTEQPFDSQQKLAELSQKIAGRENEPAEAVFSNIQRLKGIEAARLLRAMSSYSRALGVNCTHCHVTDQWASDSKATKGIAREMIGLMRTINNDLLKNIKTLKGPNPSVTCTTCHRGQLKPEVNLPEGRPK